MFKASALSHRFWPVLGILGRHLAATAGATLVTGCMWADVALAQTLNIQPSIVEIDTRNGQGQSVFTVSYVGQGLPLRVRLYSEPFTYGDNGLRPAPNDPRDLTPHLLFAPREIVLRPGQSRAVRVVARVPLTENNTEYRAVVYIENLAEANPPAGEGNQVVGTVGIAIRMGTTVFVRVGNPEATLTVTGVRYTARDRRLLLGLANSGQASTRAIVNWTLSQNGRTIASGTAPGQTIVGQSSRGLAIDYAGSPLDPGTYQLSGQVAWVDQGWALNQYQNPKTLPFSQTFEVKP